MKDRQSDPWLNIASGMPLKLAYCAQRAESELTPTAPVPAVHQLGMTREPRVIRLARTMAVLIGEVDSRVVITMVAGPPLATSGVKVAAQALLQGNVDGLESVGGTSPGKVSRRYQSLARWMWSAAEKFLPPIADEIVLTGHGLGAAVATLAALLARDRFPDRRIGVVTFGSPPVGDTDFQSEYDKLISDHTRVECEDDIIPHLGIDPLLFSVVWMEEAARLRAVYRSFAHVGRLHYFQDGREVDISEKDLAPTRRYRLFSLLNSDDREKAILDHSLVNGYLPALTSAGQTIQRVDNP